MSQETLHVLCYRWGTKYGVEYVNKLYSMVSRHLRVPHVFHCITDTVAGLDAGIVPELLPDGHFGGNWNKLMTFKPGVLGLEAGQKIVCMDLDIVIVDSIDFIADHPEQTFVIAKNWASGVRGNSSVYRVTVGTHDHVWNDFIRDPDYVIDNFHGKTRLGGDQRWVNHAITDYSYFPEGKIVSFKRHCGAKSFELDLFGKKVTTAGFGEAKVPEGAAVVLFHGDPVPPQVIHGSHGRWKKAPFVADHWR